MIRITNEVRITAGFRAATALYVVREDYTLSKQQVAGPCTWAGDTDDTRDVRLGAGQLYMLSSNHWSSHGSTVSASVEFVCADGDTAVEWSERLERPAPGADGGVLYYIECLQGIVEPVPVKTVEDLVAARVRGEVLLFISKDWVEMPFRWGDQDAACFWRLGEDGVLQEVRGCGERTPVLAPDGETFSNREDERADEFAEEAAEYAYERSIFDGADLRRVANVPALADGY